MLILAGVSLNAIIGDNGIINSAQGTKVKSGIVALEEYLREKYIEEYGNGDDLTYALDYLISSHPEMFYIPKDEGFGSLDYIESEGKSLYLIRKLGLPESIQEQLVGGDAGEGKYSDYASLNDVYGVTQKLKVYYCNNGINSISGLSVEDIDDAIDREVFSTSTGGGSNSLGELLKNYDTSEDGVISSSEVRDIKELELTSAVNLKDIYNLYALEKIVVKNVSNIDLSGIEHLTKLNFIYFYNSKAVSYEPIGKMGGKIKRLYFHYFQDAQFSKLVEDIKDYDLPNLEYLSFWNTGSDSHGPQTLMSDFANSVNYWWGQSSTGISDFSKLSELSEITQKAIKYFYADGNRITSLNGITSLVNLDMLKLNCNYITTLNGIDSLEKLRYLDVSSNSLTDSATRPESEQYTDALYSLSGCKNLILLNIRYNNNIRWIRHIKNLKLTTLYMDGLTNISDEEIINLKKEINSASTKSFNSKYTFKLIDDELTTNLNIKDQTINMTNFKKIGTAQNLSQLLMWNTKVVKESSETLGTDENTVEKLMIKVFSNLKKINYLDLANFTIDFGDGTGAHKIKNLNFINSSLYSTLYWLDLRSTDVIALGNNASLGATDKAISISNANLLNSITSLKTFIVDSDKYDFYYMQDLVSRMDKSYLLEPFYRASGLCCFDLTSLKTLEKCNRITKIETYEYYGGINNSNTLDLSKCDNLTRLYIFGWNGIIHCPSSIKDIYTVTTSCDFTFENDGTNIVLDNLKVDECSYSKWGDFTKKIANSGIHVKSYTLENIRGEGSLNCFFDNSGKCEWLDHLGYWYAGWESPYSYSKFYNDFKQLIGSSITSIDFRYSPVLNLDFLTGFENQLTSISIRSSKIQNINKIGNFKKLTSLYLTNNYITNISAVGELTNLTYLNLNNNSIGGGLSILENLHKLETLYLNGNNLYTEENVYMGSGDVKDKCVNIFKKLHTSYKLIKLDIRNTNLRGIENKLKVAPEWTELYCDPKLEKNK